MALLVVVLGIVIYLGFRFEWKFAVAGVIANLHDVVIILGFFAFFQWEFSLSVLAGVLAVLGYSVNESVVIMDRIRENFRKYRKADVHEVINNAITQTISRTIITHGSTQMMVLAMLFFGGPTLHYFAMALTIGIWFGIYSSVFVAAALAMWMGVKREDLVKPVKKEGEEAKSPDRVVRPHKNPPSWRVLNSRYVTQPDTGQLRRRASDITRSQTGEAPKRSWRKMWAFATASALKIRLAPPTTLYSLTSWPVW